MMKVKRCLYFLFTNEDNVVVINDYDDVVIKSKKRALYVLYKIPEEIQKLMDIVGPYIEKCHLREDATQEIKDTFEKNNVG